jgi:hypothetical protein
MGRHRFDSDPDPDLTPSFTDETKLGNIFFNWRYTRMRIYQRFNGIIFNGPKNVQVGSGTGLIRN